MEYKGFDFTKRDKSSALFVLCTDRGELSLHVLMPTHGALQFIEKWVLSTVMEASGADYEAIDRDEAYEAAAAILSRNKEWKRISADDLRKWEYDIEDLDCIFDAVFSFASQVADAKNSACLGTAEKEPAKAIDMR